ncbi:MAG: hypothetical protein QOD76_656 [Solirubrobacteraceae bacterium]|jgi:peptidoglycan/xylan/chitin deacetylase (PgdA/CDA1 family)|nr:hypothetical protein [Solirubrobacteraceae bacterium]
MSRRALILAYHAIEAGSGPLCLDPNRFRAQLDCLAEAGAHTMTVSELATALRRRALPEVAVAITFDDGAASVARTAVPMLAEHGMRATVFCVAGYLGRVNDWPNDPPGRCRYELATGAEIADMAAAGVEIGCHGMRHVPLIEPTAGTLRRELVESKGVLEETAGEPVSSFAYPYGVVSRDARALAQSTYAAACTTVNARAELDADLFALPRVEMHYLRRPQLLRRVLAGSDLYLRLRRTGGRARRAFWRDYARPS